MMKKACWAALAACACALAWGEVPITNGTEWTVFRFENTIKDGSILDFSNILPADRPAGTRHGRLVVDAEGRLVGEKSGERVRLVGANLNFDANFMDKETVDRLAKHFRQMGYNAVRLHHTDVLLMSGGWNGCWSDAIDEKMLDRLDYTFAAMKREGLYVTTDFYQMRRVNKAELPSLKLKENLDFGWFKGFLPIYEAAFEVWCKYPKKLMTHVNPYTKLAWKDDPALAFVVSANEDTLMSICGHRPANGEQKERRSSPRFEDAFHAWQKANEEDFALDGAADQDELWYDFIIEKGAGIQRKYVRYLNGTLGYPGLVSGVNWWDLKFSAYERGELSLVDNHGYADHPQSENNYTKWNQASNVKGHPCYAMPAIKAPTRIFGKPMAITEWQFCMPNRYRAESGPVMGAYSAFQDWDATFRFAWSHSAKSCREQTAMNAKSWFDLASDPLNQVSDRLNVLLFRRGDVSPAKERHCYAVTRKDTIASGMGDMWKGGRFPQDFTALAYRHAIGSQVVDEKRPARKGLTRLYAAKGCLITDEAQLNGNVCLRIDKLPKTEWSNADVVSDTGELVWSRAGRVTVATPRTEAIVAYPKGESSPEGFVAGGLSVKPVEKYQVVGASSLDGVVLRESSKVLFVHLSNMYNQDFAFDQANWNCVKSWGHLPYLAECATAEVTFRSAVRGLELLAIRYDGTAIRREEATYADGAYRFRLSVTPDREAVACYALVKPGTYEIDTKPLPPVKGLPVTEMTFTVMNVGRTAAKLEFTPPLGWRLGKDEPAAAEIAPGESRAVVVVPEE